MQWTPRGAHLLLQLRTRVLDGTLDGEFSRWRTMAPPPQEMPLAA